MTTTNSQAQADRNPAKCRAAHLLVGFLALCALGVAQIVPVDTGPAPDQWRSSSTTATSSLPDREADSKPAYLVIPGVAQAGPIHRTRRPAITPNNRDEALRLSRAHFRLGVNWLEDNRVPEAREEFDLALETLLGGGAVNFSGDAEARRALEDLIQEIHRLEVTRMGIGDPSQTPVFQESPLDQIPELTFPTDPSLAATVIEQIRARSGEFPLEVNDVVLSYVRYFSSERGSRTFVGGFRRSGRYRDMILRILDEEGLPRELLHLAQAESGFLPRAVSRAKAGGLWQFITSRGREYGLQQSTHTDDRFDPEKATRAAARHLRDLFNQFGDWNLAMAAYNCGPACVDRAVARTGYADFWELRRLNVIPRETTNYVPIVQALAIISLNPAAYGIELPEPDLPMFFDTHVLDAKTNLNLVSDLLGITKAEIRDLNPSVRGDVAPEGYALRVPKKSVPALIAGLSQVPAASRVAWRAHRVDEGETLTTIAKRYKTTSSAIAKVNAVSDAGPSMRQGDLLLIPATYSAPKRAVIRKKTVAKSKRSTTRKAPAATTKKTTVAGKSTSTAKAKASATSTTRRVGATKRSSPSSSAK